MKWVTRARPVIDRIACPWLIARFIDQEPEFLFVPPEPGARRLPRRPAPSPTTCRRSSSRMSATGCSFDTFLATTGSTIQHSTSSPGSSGAPTPSGLISRRSRRGLLAISLGLRSSFEDDHEVLGHGCRPLRRTVPLVSRSPGRDPQLAAQDAHSRLIDSCRTS